MVLQCTDEKLKELIIKRIISLVLTDDETESCYSLTIKSPITNEIFKLPITLDRNEIVELGLIKNNDVIQDIHPLERNLNTINEWWDLFLSQIPTNIEHGKWTKSNSDTGRRILCANKVGEDVFKINIELNNISAQTMLLAYAYDLYCHRIDSKEENKLRYVLSLDKWLSNTHRIEVLYKEAINDLVFLEYYTADPIRVEQDIQNKSQFKSLNKKDDLEYEF